MRKQTLFLASALLAVSGAMAPARATLLDFSDVNFYTSTTRPTGYTGFGGNGFYQIDTAAHTLSRVASSGGTMVAYDGLRFDQGGFGPETTNTWLLDTNPAFPQNPLVSKYGMQNLSVTGDSYIWMPATTFTFNSLYLGYFPAEFGSTITLHGLNASGTVIDTAAITVPTGACTTQGTCAMLQTFNWVGVSEVDFLTGVPNQTYEITGITINGGVPDQNPTPEPASTALVGIGLLVAGICLRKKKFVC
jgi:hypothetical protein